MEPPISFSMQPRLSVSNMKHNCKVCLLLCIHVNSSILIPLDGDGRQTHFPPRSPTAMESVDWKVIVPLRLKPCCLPLPFLDARAVQPFPLVPGTEGICLHEALEGAKSMNNACNDIVSARNTQTMAGELLHQRWRSPWSRETRFRPRRPTAMDHVGRQVAAVPPRLRNTLTVASDRN